MAVYYNTTNILNLPKVETINNNDYLLVQDANDNTKTSLLLFENFIIGLENTTFENTIKTHTDDIATLNTKIIKFAEQYNKLVSTLSENASSSKLKEDIQECAINFDQI